MLASRFGANRKELYSRNPSTPLSDDEIRRVAPSIYAENPHGSRSERYTYIPTVEVLTRLRKEGFQPFMVCQAKTRDESRREHTKHMLRLRHASQAAGAEAHEIVMLNSHDGTTSYQMFDGVFRFICANGMVCGDKFNEVRVPHKGNVVDEVLNGAYEILDGYTRVIEDVDQMKRVELHPREQQVFAEAALQLRFDDGAPAPVTEDQVLRPKRSADVGSDLWRTFNRLQENLTRGGLSGRNKAGRPTTTRAVQGIDSSLKLNRALWTLAERMRELKGA